MKNLIGTKIPEKELYNEENTSKRSPLKRIGIGASLLFTGLYIIPLVTQAINYDKIKSNSKISYSKNQTIQKSTKNYLEPDTNAYARNCIVEEKKTYKKAFEIERKKLIKTPCYKKLKKEISDKFVA